MLVNRPTVRNGVVLPVPVQQNPDLPPGLPNTRLHRRPIAHVARPTNHQCPGGLGQERGIIRGAVIHYDDLMGQMQPVQFQPDPLTWIGIPYGDGVSLLSAIVMIRLFEWVYLAEVQGQTS